jgi:16S rRNA (cytosine967-C5)-methyltransferase
MTPAARYAAAIAVLDKIVGGEAAEKALTNWARGNRFAGSGDRHALRDIVFDVLRCKRSYAALGGGETGRGLVLGALRAADIPPGGVFTGIGYAPAVLTDDEIRAGSVPAGNVALDCPDWLAPALHASLGPGFAPVMQTLQSRAPVFLRVNLRRASVDAAVAALARDGVEAAPHGLATSALMVLKNPRKVQASHAFLDGMVELQDAASQAVVEALPLATALRVLDYCAGGGGKTLAMAALTDAQIFAHDIAPTRMKDLPARAKRAGIAVQLCDTKALTAMPPFDLVLADAPCTGSGSWRRSPEAKWALSPQRLETLMEIQSRVMDQASALTVQGGVFAYVTCSLLQAENQDQVTAFLARNRGWKLDNARVLTPLDGGDGFFIAILRRDF